MTVQHRDLANGRWFAMSLAEQMANIGSEVSRATRWSGKNADLAHSALYRALELLDLTLDDPRHRRSVARLRELARTREVLIDFFDGRNEFATTASSLQRYFDQFARAARASR
jgi:hypothetical protein